MRTALAARLTEDAKLDVTEELYAELEQVAWIPGHSPLAARLRRAQRAALTMRVGALITDPDLRDAIVRYRIEA